MPRRSTNTAEPSLFPTDTALRPDTLCLVDQFALAALPAVITATQDEGLRQEQIAEAAYGLAEATARVRAARSGERQP